MAKPKSPVVAHMEATGLSYHGAKADLARRNRSSGETAPPKPPRPQPDLRAYEFTHDSLDASHFLIGLYSDTHKGSAYEAEEELASFYDLCRQRGVQHLYNAGDVNAGVGVYRGQIYELRRDCIQVSEQATRAARDFITCGMPVSYVLGNHDLKALMTLGVDVGQHIDAIARAEGAPVTCLGHSTARVLIGKPPLQCVLDLLHPTGGTAYAISYRAQKVVESYGGGDKPHVVVIGHYHKAEELPQMRNVVAIQPGCFEWQTPFMKTKSIEAHVAGCIMEGWMKEVNGRPSLVRIRLEWAKFYAPARSAAG